MAEELRSEAYRVLRKPHHPKPNLKKEEIIALNNSSQTRAAWSSQLIRVWHWWL